jgi:hypothetical protein
LDRCTCTTGNGTRDKSSRFSPGDTTTSARALPSVCCSTSSFLRCRRYPPPVGLHGYPRATVDLDVWVRAPPDNAERIVQALRAFGFDLPALNPQLFVDPPSIVRFGTPPFRIVIMTSIDGVEFDACRRRPSVFDVDGVPVR